MAKKLRTGFELPFSNATGSDQTKTFSFSGLNNYVFNGKLLGINTTGSTTQYPIFTSAFDGSNDNLLSFDTTARTLTNGSRGTYWKYSVLGARNVIVFYDTTDLTSGFYYSNWVRWTDIANGRYKHLLNLYDGTNTYNCSLYQNTGSTDLAITQANTSTNLNTATIAKLSANTWYLIRCGINNSGEISFDVNGTSLTHTLSGTPAFSTWQRVGFHASGGSASEIDDLSINDGSGASDNGLPNSIRGYNFFDAATLNSNTGFSAVGGTTPLANLQDGDDTTRVSATADLSVLDFSLPTLSGTGMAETAANFNKIECINVYGRQIEATKASSLLKAKIIDDTAVVNREENISLPLTVGNGSVTMFDDGSSDWSLTNLDAGNFDFELTFDKP